jgi:hypothetical protein
VKQRLLFDAGDSFRNRAVKDVTFQGKLCSPIHRWYRLTPSFSPRLATDLAEYFGLGADDLVLDPFSGVGTVPVCMKYAGIPTWAVELNPYLYFVSRVKTRTYEDIDSIEAAFRRFLRRFGDDATFLPSSQDAPKYLKDHREFLPRIHNPTRWWSPANLMQLVCLRKLALEHDAEPEHSDLIRMAILAILVAVSNAKHNHVSLTFGQTPQPRLDIRCILEAKMREMVTDLREVAGSPRAEVEVFNGNSKSLCRVLPTDRKASAVITSPPYPNRFSYARETRPHLFFFDFVETPAAVGDLETDAIGGTWGKATSVLARGVSPKNSIVRRILASHLEKVEEHGGLMASYVIKYFNDMFDHAAEVARVARRNCRLAYVIGNSKFFGNPLESDGIIAELFGQFGFQLERIDRMRKRQSKTGLHESVVLMYR